MRPVPAGALKLKHLTECSIRIFAIRYICGYLYCCCRAAKIVASVGESQVGGDDGREARGKRVLLRMCSSSFFECGFQQQQPPQGKQTYHCNVVELIRHRHSHEAHDQRRKTCLQIKPYIGRAIYTMVLYVHIKIVIARSIYIYIYGHL